MKNLITALILTFTFALASNAQIKIEDTVLDYKIEYNGVALKLNGAGTRSNLILGDLYIGALYLQNKSDDAMDIAFADETMAIHLVITSKVISKETLHKAIVEGFEKATDGNVEVYQDRIQKIRELYSKDINKGDTLDFVYIKGKGLVCYFNKNELGVIEGQDFKFVHYKIWLGEKPASKTLKKAMLGKV